MVDYMKYKPHFKKIYDGIGLIIHGIKIIFENYLYNNNILPKRPTLLQFPVTERCNSHCIMCNIWRQPKKKEITSYEINYILQDPLFSDIRYVGINGGEPTLRSDLTQISNILFNALPKLKGVGLITNAIDTNNVIQQCIELDRFFKKFNVDFNVEVSIDGIGEIHDKNRNVKGNFNSAEFVIKSLRNHGISVSISSTITPINCYWADDIILWCEQNGINKYKFRLATEINRLYNQGFNKNNGFCDHELFHLIQFFDKLANDFRINKNRRIYYKSLVGQLAKNNNRTAGCYWQRDGITLDALGNISYCSVKSPLLGSAIKESASEIYFKGLPIRDKIIKEMCVSCKHDLDGEIPGKELIKDGCKLIFNPIYQVYLNKTSNFKYHNISENIKNKTVLPKQVIPKKWQSVLITGWYGTETAGDKAILGEILHFIKEYTNCCDIQLTTLNKIVSEQTKKELKDMKDVEIIDINNASDSSRIKDIDAVIVGGGPLGDWDELNYIWEIFKEANKQNKEKILFGCGLGPIYKENTKKLIEGILKITDRGFFRDEESYNYGQNLIGNLKQFETACDPALGFLKRWKETNNVTSSSNNSLNIAGLLRANTTEYVKNIDSSQLKELNSINARKIAHLSEEICESFSTKINLLPMHSLWVGGDDRLFNREIANNFQRPEFVNVERRYLDLDTLLKSLNSNDFCLPMRYHGHLFCCALGIPFLSIDYSGKKGKVGNFIRRINLESNSIGWNDINENSYHKAERIIQNRDNYAERLIYQTDSLVNNLERTYNRIFNIN